MCATFITELINFNVVLPSAEAQILNMAGPEAPSFQGSNSISFYAIPPPCAPPFFIFTTLFTCG